MNRYSNWRTKQRERRRLRCQAIARRSNEVQAAARLLRPVNADTLRRRALDDARGAVLREGRTYTTAGETHWQVRRSISGRVNQVDIVVDGRAWRTLGRRKAASMIRGRRACAQ